VVCPGAGLSVHPTLAAAHPLWLPGLSGVALEIDRSLDCSDLAQSSVDLA
jgi:hypothetical protein